MKFFKSFDNYITPLIIIALIALFAANMFWLFDKKTLSENLDIQNASEDITFYYSESITEDRGDEGIYYIDNIYTISSPIDDEKIQPLLNVLNQIESRKRSSGNGSILVHTTGMSKLYIEFFINDDFYSYILTDRDNIMRCHSPVTGEIISITLGDGDFETLAESIKLYGQLQ